MPRKVLVPALLALVLLFFTVFGSNGLLSLIRLNSSKEQMKERIARVNEENSAIKVRIEALKGDRRYLEGLARTNFGLVKANEVVFRFDSSAHQPTATSALPRH